MALSLGPVSLGATVAVVARGTGTGGVDRPFDHVTNDGQIYCYGPDPLRPEVSWLITMTGPSALNIRRVDNRVSATGSALRPIGLGAGEFEDGGGGGLGGLLGDVHRRMGLPVPGGPLRREGLEPADWVAGQKRTEAGLGPQSGSRHGGVDGEMDHPGPIRHLVQVPRLDRPATAWGHYMGRQA